MLLLGKIPASNEDGSIIDNPFIYVESFNVKFDVKF